MTEENQPSQQPIDADAVPTADADPAPLQVPAPPAAPAQWPAAPAAGYPAPVYPAAPPGAVYAPAYAPRPKTSSNAIIALVLSIASWVVCPVIPAIVGLVFASMAGKEIEASGEQIQGRGMVTAARIVSWINIGFYAAVFIVGAFVLVLFAIAGGMDSVRSN